MLAHPVNNKVIYRKSIRITAFPNNTTGNFPHSITGLDATGFFRISGYITDGTNAENVLLAASLTVINVDATNIDITTTADLSGSDGVIDLEYTKT